MCIPQTPTNRNNTGFTDNSFFVNISGSNENLGFIDNSGLADKFGFTDNSVFTKKNNLPSDDVRVSGSSSKNAEKHNDPSVTLRHYEHHSMTVTTLITCLKKQNQKIITYRNYKSININTFNNELDKELKNINISNKHITYDLFKTCFMSIVNKHAPLKKS